MLLVKPLQPECVGHSIEFCRVLEIVNTIASRECTVMLLGESGTGKEMMARQVHRNSRRASGPFIPVDCTILSEELFASQLFGHVKGAFTGADRDTLGFFCTADGGTIFLDEIGELPLSVQGKFLRVLQESKVTPVGATAEHPVDVRVICATNRNLDEMVEQGRFKRDLYYRLKVIEVKIPPLRERREDILPLTKYFLRKQAQRYSEPPKSLSPEVIAALEAYEWPGNVRELANVVEYAYVLSKNSRLTLSDLPDAVRMAVVDYDAGEDRVMPLELAEKALVVNALRIAGGNQARAARMLQIERRRLYRMIDRYRLQSFVGRKISDTG